MKRWYKKSSSDLIGLVCILIQSRCNGVRMKKLAVMHPSPAPDVFLESEVMKLAMKLQSVAANLYFVACPLYTHLQQ